MVYLQPGDYVRFGLAVETPDTLVTTASALIDGYCRRASLAVTSYTERLRFARDGSTLRLSYGPVVAVTACRVRLRRMRGQGLQTPLTPLQADAMVLGLGGSWQDVDPTTIALAVDGEAEITPGLLGVLPDEAEITYTAGYTAVPDVVGTACAQIVRNALNTPGLTVRRQQVDALEMEYFSGSLLDADVQRLLQPFCAVRCG